MTDSPVRVAAIDIDETLIDGQSQQLFIRYLVKRRAAPVWTLAYAALAFALYKARWHVDFSRMQQQVVAGFRGMPLARVDELFEAFVSADLKRRIRADGLNEIEALRHAGAAVMLVSGAIAPLAARIAAAVGVGDVVATGVAPPVDGRFSGQVEGSMLLGNSKLAAVRRHAERRFGAGGWRLWRVYGDHEADLALLQAAEEPIVVCPTSGLREIAKARGWPIVLWR
jgi:HAD superfamily hydrolase (TIGR01490 family)